MKINKEIDFKNNILDHIMIKKNKRINFEDCEYNIKLHLNKIDFVFNHFNRNDKERTNLMEKIMLKILIK